MARTKASIKKETDGDDEGPPEASAAAKKDDKGGEEAEGNCEEKEEEKGNGEKEKDADDDDDMEVEPEKEAAADGDKKRKTTAQKEPKHKVLPTNKSEEDEGEDDDDGDSKPKSKKKKKDDKDDDDDTDAKSPPKSKKKKKDKDEDDDEGDEEEDAKPKSKSSKKSKKSKDDGSDTPKSKKKSKKSKKKKKDDSKKKKKKKPPPPPEPEEYEEEMVEKKPSKIDEYELKFGSLEVVLAAGDLETDDPREKFLVGRLQEDILFGCDKEAYVSVEWYDLVKDNLFEAQGLDNLDFLPVGSLVCSVTRFAKEGFSRGRDTLTLTEEAWKYGNRKLKEQLDDDYESDEDSQFGDEVVSKRLKFIRKQNIDSGVKGRKPMSAKSGKRRADDDDDEDDDGDDDSDAPKTPSRKRKAGKKKSPASPSTTAKKAKRGLTPRPDIEVVEDPFDRRTGKIESYDGDVERATKEVFRAVQSEDLKALEAAVKSTDIIFSVHYPRSIGLPVTPLMFAMVDGNVEATKILLDDTKDNEVYERRARLQRCALPKLTTGRISGRHADYNRRKVGASRGGREGNNALLYDAAGDEYNRAGLAGNGVIILPENQIPTHLFKYQDEMIDMNLGRDFDEIPDEILDLAEATYSRTLRNHMVIENIMRGGQRLAAKRYIEQQLNIPYLANNFNFLHVESLGDVPDDEKKPFSKDVLARSVAKQSGTETRFSPLACACINPEVAYLEAMLKVAPEHANLNDSRDTSLVHYAAACEGPDPLKYLLKSHSLSKTGIDKRKETPMHYAARAARVENIRVLLEDCDSEQKKSMLSAKTSEGFAPIHYAVISQRCDALETIRALLEKGADANLASSAPRNKVSPVHLAARMGNLEALKLLVEHGGNPSKGDKLGRSPLVHACLNGHSHVVSHLLMMGVSVETADSSDNYAVHYAAAYGYDDCLQLLLDAGADPDVKNSWKTSPLSVAVQKGRHRVSSLLFKLPSVDVNFKDDDGKTLLFRLIEGFIAEKMLNEAEKTEFALTGKKGKGNIKDEDEIAALRKDMPWALRKLLDRTDVDWTTTDADGSSILHLLCYQNYTPDGSGEKRAVALAKLMFSRSKVDLDAKDSDGLTPLLCAAKRENALLLEFLVNRGASLSPDFVDADGENICHLLLMSNEACRKHLKLVEEKAGPADFRALLISQNGLGFTPIHKTVRWMTSVDGDGYDSLYEVVESLVARFPELATTPVGPISLLKDPDRLAALILAEDEGGEDNSRHHHHRRSSNQTQSPGIVSESERTDASKVRKALGSRDRAVPSTSNHYGKRLIHFICECKSPKRTKELLEWIIPLSKSVIDTEAGIEKDVFTPLQQLLYKVLPSSDLQHPLPSSGNWQKDRLKSLNLVLESIQLLQKHGAKDSSGSGGVFGKTHDELQCYRDGGDKELTEDDDTEKIKALKRCADAIVNKKDESAKDEIIELFEKAMLDRQMRVLAMTLKSGDFRHPLPHHLAQSNSSIPTSVWSSLIKKCGLDLTQCDTEGRSVLHIALNKQDAELSRFLCEESPELVSKASNTGERPVHVVAKIDKATFVRLLLEHAKDTAAEVNCGDNSGRTAFHFSVEKAAKRTGEVLDPCEIIFLQAGARLDIADDINQRTPLHYCFLERASVLDHFNFPHSLEQGSHDRVELASSLLAAKGAAESVTMTDKFGRTPLCYAAAYNSTVSSLLLVSKGANLFHQDQDGNTPINIAVLRGHDSFAITLLKSVGSENLPELVDVVDIRRVKKTNDAGETTIEVNQKHVHSIVWHAIGKNLRGLVYILLDTSFPLQQAAIDALNHGSFQLVRKLLTTSPPEVIRHVDDDSGRNLLHEVARVGHYSNSEWSTTLAEILLSSDIPAAAQTKDGQTALHIAAQRGHIDLVRLLVKTDQGPVQVFDNEGHLPLTRFMRHLSGLSLSEYQCVEMVSLLTSGIESLSDTKYNKVPRTKGDAKTIRYDGIAFELGPNKESVREEVMSRWENKSGEEASTDVVDGYSTLIIQTLHAQRYRVMQQLMDKGAPVGMADSKGLSALHHAALSNCERGAMLLLRNKTDPDIVSDDEHSVTPLIVASFQCGVNPKIINMAKLLIRFGADASKVCKSSGVTALHIACRENNLEFASLVLRAALHAGAKEKKGKEVKSHNILARFGGDCALYPGKILGDIVSVHALGDKVPLSLVSESFECQDLRLDSAEALAKLKLRKDKGDAMEELDDNDEEQDRDEIAEARRTLTRFYGIESMITGNTDVLLTKPLKVSAVVIVQNKKPREYANQIGLWMEGKVIAAYDNGTYDVDVYRGLPMHGVTRQQLRPWKSGSIISWPTKGDKSSKVSALLEAKDKQGHTPLMATVKPVEFGSYERCQMVDLLVEYGATVDAESMALARPGSEFLKHLQELSEGDAMDTTETGDNSSDMKAEALYGLEPVAVKVFEEESKRALIELEAKGLLKKKHEPPRVNPVCELKAAGLRVLPVQDEAATQYYDVVMTKVELSHHGYSENKYYKMQVVEDPNKSLFVLVTNWGQIGDYGGQKQETPFGSREEAVTEFTKVFKAKSGNLWTDFIASNFEPKLGKYKPARLLASGFEKPKLPNLVEMVESPEDHPDTVRGSSLPPDISETMKALVDPEAIGAAARNLGLQEEKLPLGQLSIETLLEAEKKLEQIAKSLGTVEKLTKAEQLKEKREAMDQVAILSSEYFELLPTKEDEKALAPLDKRGVKEQKDHILVLKSLTAASHIVNTACVKGNEVNPLDYAYRCMRGTLEVLPKDTPERIGVEQYFRNTSNNNELVISQVYQLNRFDEKSNKNMKNHRLLWHGTAKANVMGVIKEGLRVAPPTAMQSGNAFGDGVYFADMVSKSWHYCRANFSTSAKEMPKAYLFLADVALGQQERFSEANWGQAEVDESIDSVWAVGYEGPDVDKDIVFSKSGAVMPLGKVMRSPTFHPKGVWKRGYEQMTKEMNEAIETVRSSTGTKYPVCVKTEYRSNPAEVVIEHGPFADSAKVVPVKVRKVSDKFDGKDNKKRKDNEGKAIKTEEDSEEEVEDDEYEPKFKEFTISRSEEGLASYVHYNEFIVRDTNRINLRYLVEVTSRSWLKNEAEKEAKARSREAAKARAKVKEEEKNGNDEKSGKEAKSSNAPKSPVKSEGKSDSPPKSPKKAPSPKKASTPRRSTTKKKKGGK